MENSGITLYKADGLYALSDMLVENGCDVSSMVVTIEVPNQYALNKINEDLYYRETDGSSTGIVKDVDEINISVQGLRVKYILKQNDSRN